MSLEGNARTNVLEGYIDSLNVIHGKSAYEIALMNGFQGTEEEWVESLHGYILTDNDKRNIVESFVDIATEKAEEVVTAERTAREEAVTTERRERKSEIAIERARIDRLSSLPEGSTTGDAELLDARIGADGKTYSNTGEAVRGQFRNLREELVESIGTEIREDVIVHDVSGGVYNYPVKDGAYGAHVSNLGDYNSSYATERKDENGISKTAISRSTEKIPVEPKEEYKIEGSCNSYYALVTEFDENGAWIASFGGSQINKFDFTESAPYKYTVPDKRTLPDGTEKKVAFVVFSTVHSILYPLKVKGPVLKIKNVDNSINAKFDPFKETVNENQKKTDDFKDETGNNIAYLLNNTNPNETSGPESSVKPVGGLNATAIDILIQILAEGNNTNEAQLDALREALGTSKDAPPILRLQNNLPDDVYTLRYEDEDGKTDKYVDICTFTISQGEAPAYDKFISYNIAPENAVNIGVYNASGKRFGDVVLGALANKPDFGNKLYTFAAFSDIHIGKNKNEDYYENRESATPSLPIQPDSYLERFKQVMPKIEDNEDIAFTVICGDMVDKSEIEWHLKDYKSVVWELEKPVYVATGNHESINAINANIPFKDVYKYFNQEKYPNINQALDFTFSPEGTDDVFIILGITGSYKKFKALSPEQLQWLQQTLEDNRNKRCFLFHHYFPYDGSGDAIECYDQNGLQGARGDSFYDILKQYPNVIYFHGHTHAKFEIQEMHPMNTIDTIFGRYSVHIPSLTCPTYPNAEMKEYLDDLSASEGYIIDVYENGIVLKGTDFVNDKYSPLGYYALDTTIKEVAENSFYDNYGFTNKAFKNVVYHTADAQDKNYYPIEKGWYKDCSVDSNRITKISFVDFYKDDYDESWIPTVSDVGIMAYRKGTEIFIDCKGNRVHANNDCGWMFAGFSALTEIYNLWKLDMSNVENIEGMFYGCTNLKSLFLKKFDEAKPNETLRWLFSGCSSLTSLDISNFNLERVNKFQNMCMGCTSLESIKLPEIHLIMREKKLPSGKYVTEQLVVYLNSVFEGCSSLREMDMTRVTGIVSYSSAFKNCTSLEEIKFGSAVSPISMANLFTACSKLKTIDISKFDTSGLTSLTQTFDGCTSLTEVILPDVVDTSQVENMVKCFADCPELTLDCSGWDTTKCKGNKENETGLENFNQNSPGVIPPTKNEAVTV
jgi:surface protein